MLPYGGPTRSRTLLCLVLVLNKYQQLTPLTKPHRSFEIDPLCLKTPHHRFPVLLQAMDDTSYPPLFRQTNPNPNPNPNHSPHVDPNPKPTIDVPLVDLQNLDPVKLGDACRDWGFFRLVNHGIPPTLSAQLHHHAKELLSLPFDSKQAQFTHPVTYFWGTPALTQRVRNLNWVEGLHVPLGQLQRGGGDPDSTASSSSSSFRCLVDEYGRHMACIVRRLFDALAINLKLDNEQLSSYLLESDGTLRVYRYPCCPEAHNCFGMDAHTDSSVLSVLNQDEVGGLQVRRDNIWFDVTPIPGTLIVNLGDMMQAISNDEYKSAQHRVLANRSIERISLCYFAFPSEDGVIASSKYRAFTYREFKAKVQEDIKATGSKVGLKRFLVGDPS